MGSDQTAYLLAESMEERVAVGMIKFYRLWQEAYGPGTLPDLTACQKSSSPLCTRKPRCTLTATCTASTTK